MCWLNRSVQESRVGTIKSKMLRPVQINRSTFIEPLLLRVAGNRSAYRFRRFKTVLVRAHPRHLARPVASLHPLVAAAARSAE